MNYNGIQYEFTQNEIEAIVQLIDYAREKKELEEVIETVAVALNRNAFKEMGMKLEKD